MENIERGKTTVVKLIKEMLKDVDMLNTQSNDSYIWIPFFNKVCLPFDLTDFLYNFSNSMTMHIKSAFCGFDFEITGDVIDKGVSFKPDNKSVMFNDDFIFGFLHTDVEEMLDIPLVAAIIQEKDFVYQS